MKRFSTVAIAVMLVCSLVLPGLAGCAGSGFVTDAANGSGEVARQSVDATAENVRIIGRTYAADGATWLAQSGSAVEFAVSGTHVELELLADEHAERKEELRPRFAVLVDGEVIVDETMGERVRAIEVLDAQSSVNATVEVILLSEAAYGAVGVRSIAVDSVVQDPVSPTAAKNLSIEFVGDSITCGYGVEGTVDDLRFQTTTENFMKSYAYLAAKALDADYSAVCYSGFGVVSGWSADGTKTGDMLLPPLYDLVTDGRSETWDSSSHPYDVVVINLGTNDSTYTGTDEGRMEEFVGGYVDLIEQVRSEHPEAFIICTVGAMEDGVMYPLVERAVENHKASTGDERVTSYLTEPIDVERDGVGTHWHPNEITQQKDADALVEVIRSVLGLQA